ncbi:Nuclear envelope morphology protein 1 like [Verticillium longisporum]|uniref:Nuclear envelope morphology protein 1 like n=1 Tax=Verticillium longisporum TaxID=100787 RepID=A0A8I3ARL2_VERLO|nr:Nuclear envelope morphology protein 1 like [Verticillium longisporum]KAG7136627.1 Nuclear envelope morphology protein 1 like [Verticillium longisporum]
MNSLNIITSRVSPPPSPGPSRSNSFGSIGMAVEPNDDSCDGDPDRKRRDDALEDNISTTVKSEKVDEASVSIDAPSEYTALMNESKEAGVRAATWHSLPRSIATTFINSIRWFFSTLTAPGVYLIACLYDSSGAFAPLSQLRKLFGTRNDKFAHESGFYDEKNGSHLSTSSRAYGTLSRPVGSSGSSSSGLSSESESDPDHRNKHRSSVQRHTRSKTLQDTEEIAPSRRSIRIKLHSEEGLRKHRKTQSASSQAKRSDGTAVADISAQLKSPTSPAGALTKYPRTPAPPRPLIPRRQPSYLNLEQTDRKYQKTLILDLDETLIHSMSKGGRMSTGHMVEVRLNQTYVGAGGQTSLGPQHPILYWVNKRPYCDDFLRRICKWYNLVVFTASVQEYADPVIDWLESERKFFSARYYRQHCTFRQGAFIKDLSSVEPDLSRVMILDNSPLSYMFHQDNAIPIQGWINDPTDNDLLHLVPLLEGLQYVSDVRALLALRGGEDGQHMA